MFNMFTKQVIPDLREQYSGSEWKIIKAFDISSFFQSSFLKFHLLSEWNSAFYLCNGLSSKQLKT